MDYKEFKIPKKSGKHRKICAPDKELLNYQRKALPMLVEHFTHKAEKYGVLDHFHGFIPNKNVVTCAQKHIGFKCTLMMDISSFFDTVTHDMVEDMGVFSDPYFYHKDGYCAQGFATSPILANIAIIKAVKEIEQVLILNNIGKDYAFTIYADDIQISLNDDSYEKTDYVISVVTTIMKQHGFSINSKKTRIKYAKYGFRRILGVNVGDTEVRATRKTMRKIRAARHSDNGPSLGGLVTWSKCMLPNPDNKRLRKERHQKYKESLSGVSTAEGQTLKWDSQGVKWDFT